MPLYLPDGALSFVDATIFHYALIPTFDTSPDCLAFLDRAIAGEVEIVTSVQVLADVVHKTMTSEAAQFAKRDRASMIGYLKKHPEILLQCTKWPKALEELKSIPMRILEADFLLLDEAAKVSQAFGLLTNDSMIIASMQRHGVTHLATNDDDFDRVPGITVWKPRP
jgi:predicted nucleic acid-binding protein